MGYDVHVTRKEFWADDEGPEITLEEWLEYVGNDPEIEPDADNPGEENFVIVSHPNRWPLWWGEGGEVFTKNPDKLVMEKLVKVARDLNARVLGDDDEIYGVDPGDPTVFRRQ
jgi:hypothetical protein